MRVRDLDDDILAAFVKKDFADFAESEISRKFSNMSDQIMSQTQSPFKCPKLIRSRINIYFKILLLKYFR